MSPENGIFEDDFPFPQVGYVNFLEGNLNIFISCFLWEVEWILAIMFPGSSRVGFVSYENRCVA